MELNATRVLFPLLEIDTAVIDLHERNIVRAVAIQIQVHQLRFSEVGAARLCVELEVTSHIVDDWTVPNLCIVVFESLRVEWWPSIELSFW